ncbi:MAG: cation:proton antiporter [Treponema sp.]|nr:cation:proton antiporter [Treponema sp.]
MNVTELMTELVLQIGVILFAVRVCGELVKRIGIPSVLGELLAGVIIGPYALGSIAFPGFERGLFPLAEGGALAVSPELYGFATVASIILLFASGLETDIALFLRYSLAGGLIGIGGVVVAFISGDMVGMALLHAGFMDPRCLFLGVLSTATSVGITARILSDQKKMDSPEGVTILAAAVFDDVLGIIMLAVILGIVALLTSNSGGSLDVGSILLIAGKAFGIWLGFTALGLIFAKHIAGFLKIFKASYDFSILALGIALVLAGVFEKQGLAMIIGAYIAGLSLSKTDIAAVIQERIHGLYEFFVPLFFAVMGMMVNVRELASIQVLLFGAIYTLMAIAAKLLGCGLSALALGFNAKGALRIGTGMVPRGEVALIIAGIGLSSGVLDSRLFGVIILMTFITTIAAPPLLSIFLKWSGVGTRKPAKDNDAATATWDFSSDEIADLVIDTLLKQLRAEGFYVQMMNINDGLSQARKDDISLSIIEEENKVSIVTGKDDMSFVKTAMYEVILTLSDSIQKLKETSNPTEMKKELAQMVECRTLDNKLLSLIEPDCVTIDLKGNNKNAIITELVDLLASRGRLNNRDEVLHDVFERERSMSTGMEHGIALPHGKSDGVDELKVAIGIKKDGIDFGSLDGERSRLFIMVVAPRKMSGPHVQFLASISAILRGEATRQELLKASTTEKVVELLRGK